MRIAVVTCDAYRDAWPAFHFLFRKFWPDCPYPVTTYSDSGSKSWTEVAVECANDGEDPVMVFQEDFFLTHPVEIPLIEQALDCIRRENIGAVRLFPCPGYTGPGNEPFGIINRNEPYRTSLQVTIWRPEYLHEIAEHCGGTRAADFELGGNAYASKDLRQDVMAFRRDLYPFPIQYICSAITRGKWEPAAKTLCDSFGIEMDWSHRGFNAA